MPTNNTHTRRAREIARLILSIAAENPELRFMQIVENALASCTRLKGIINR